MEEIAIREAIVNHPEGYEGVTAIGPGLGLTEEFIAMNSVRAVFYFFVASLLNLTYHASVYRTYFKELLAEMMISASEPTLRVLRFIEREYRVGLVEEGTFACVEQVAPLLLSASFRKVKTCEDVRERIVELRSLARPFREKRTELTLAVRDRDFAACKKLAGAVRAEARRLAEAEYLAGRTAAGRFVISLGGTRPLFGTLGHLLVAFSPLPAEVKEIIKTRFVRPEVWVFQRIGSDARQVLDVWPSLLGVLRARGFSPEKYEMELLSEGMARLSNASL